MSRFTKLFAVTATALSLGLLGAPMASADTPSADPVMWGSAVICLNLGSVTVCI